MSTEQLKDLTPLTTNSPFSVCGAACIVSQMAAREKRETVPPVTEFGSASGVASPWLDHGTAELDQQGQIIEMDHGLAVWLNMCGAGDAESLTSLLAKAFPGADRALQDLFSRGRKFDAVEVGHEVEQGRWLRLEITRHAAGAVIRIESILPPGQELSESGWRTEFDCASSRDWFLRLVKAESQLANVARRLPGVIFTQTPDLSFRYISPQVERMTGIAPTDWIRSSGPFWDLIHEADVQDMQQHIKRAAESGELLPLTFRVRHAKTGKILYLLEHRQAQRSGNGLVLSYEGVWLDITRQTIAEKRLSMAAWKETLAMLTMGLAHDFNNILAGISALSESFLTQVENNPALTEGLELIRQNSRHAGQLVQRMISLHRSKTGERNYHDFNGIVTEFADLTEKIIPRRIIVRRELIKDSLPVYADAVELRQMMLNFTLNAADAMPDRGQLVIRTSRHETWENPGGFTGHVPRLPCLCLEIADTGSGIPARHIPLLFDPFFTTKPVNKGSGLGLYNAKLCVEKHMGGISVESTEGSGTTFRVWLPQADFTEAERIETQQPRRNVLVLGQPGPLLDSSTEFLRSAGYYVLRSFTMEQAKELLAAEENAFCCLVILADPRDSSVTPTVGLLRKAYPDLKIILQITAQTADELDSELMTCGHMAITPEMSEAEILKRLEQLLS